MGALGIPGVINNFNLYNNGTALVGLTGEISLPDFEGMTETLSGPGILGEIEEVIIGQFGSMELEIPFRILDEDAFKLRSPATSLNLTLRASEQFTVKSTGGIDYKGMRSSCTWTTEETHRRHREAGRSDGRSSDSGDHIYHD